MSIPLSSKSHFYFSFVKHSLKRQGSVKSRNGSERKALKQIWGIFMDWNEHNHEELKVWECDFTNVNPHFNAIVSSKITTSNNEGWDD